MKISLAYSPCPNDTFAFHAMTHSLVDTEGLEFDLCLKDVQELNEAAFRGEYDVCKLSYHAFFTMADRYLMLNCGSALGFNNGPILVKRAGANINFNDTFNKELYENGVVAIPGEQTTAALLLKVAYPKIKNVRPILFSEIEGAILRSEVDAGVLIHEGRFVYREKGLELIRDLGEFWQSTFKSAIPLGGIAVRRDLECASKVERVLRRSIEYARAHPEASADYVAQNAQELSPQVQRKHVELFVNDYTLDVGSEGKEAVYLMYDKFLELNSGYKKVTQLFL